MDLKVKRGEKSWEYLSLTYAILLAISSSVISIINVNFILKILFIIVDAIILFLLCFKNSWFRNKIVGIFSNLQDFEEKHNSK